MVDCSNRLSVLHRRTATFDPGWDKKQQIAASGEKKKVGERKETGVIPREKRREVSAHLKESQGE